MSESQRALIERCLKGEQAAWRTLIDLHAGLVYAIARRHGLRHDQCDDVAQSVFSALSRALKSINDPEAIAGWLATSTRRESWRVARAAKRHAPSPAIAEMAAPASNDEVARLESAHAVRLAMQRIDPRCRDLLTALFLQAERPDYQVISEQLSIPIGSIGPTRARCLGKLGTLIESKTRTKTDLDE